ncbi:MAG TPA: hypothetical protein VIV12_00315 [Streptosporangiaceae bacterium]
MTAPVQVRVDGAPCWLLADAAYAPEVARLVREATRRVLASIFIVDPQGAVDPFLDLLEAREESMWHGTDVRVRGGQPHTATEPVQPSQPLRQPETSSPLSRTSSPLASKRLNANPLPAAAAASNSPPVNRSSAATTRLPGPPSSRTASAWHTPTRPPHTRPATPCPRPV